jgi:hypothetical protein
MAFSVYFGKENRKRRKKVDKIISYFFSVFTFKNYLYANYASFKFDNNGNIEALWELKGKRKRYGNDCGGRSIKVNIFS